MKVKHSSGDTPVVNQPQIKEEEQMHAPFSSTNTGGIPNPNTNNSVRQPAVSEDLDIFADDVEEVTPQQVQQPQQVRQPQQRPQSQQVSMQNPNVRPQPSQVNMQNPNARPQTRRAGTQNVGARPAPPQNNVQQGKQPNAKRQARVPQQNIQNADFNINGKGAKKKSKLVPILIGVVAVIIVGVIAVKVIGGRGSEAVVDTSYETTGRYALDIYQNNLKNLNDSTVEALRGIAPDSWVALEWDYANKNEVREQFLKSVAAYTTFDYPSTAVLDKKGNPVSDADGNVISNYSTMNNNDTMRVTVVDFAVIEATMKEDAIQIRDKFEKSINTITKEPYSISDYNYHDEMIDLMCDYVLAYGTLPTKTVELQMPVALSGDRYIVADDSQLDKYLFSSDDLHKMEDTFTCIAAGYDYIESEDRYVTYETVTTEVEDYIENPEYTEWHNKLMQYMEEDGGKFNKRTSKWEPWYLRDENNNYVLDENGEKIVNYYTIKDENGNDIKQPEEKIKGKKQEERKVPVDFKAESGVTYVWCGTYYIKNEYTGDQDTTMQVGDGSIQRPAGIGTYLITKVMGTDGYLHDVRIKMTGYWVEQNAINYATTFSEKNRGFDNSSIVKLMCYELQVENLEKNPITVNSEMFLGDANANQSSRTGTMYGFYNEGITINPHEAIIMNDWSTSTELSRKYVCWGKTFGRAYPVIYFKVLAANNGVVDSYDATESTINRQVEVLTPEEAAEREAEKKAAQEAQDAEAEDEGVE